MAVELGHIGYSTVFSTDRTVARTCSEQKAQKIARNNIVPVRTCFVHLALVPFSPAVRVRASSRSSLVNIIPTHLSMYVYVHTYMSMCVRSMRERERERASERVCIALESFYDNCNLSHVQHGKWLPSCICTYEYMYDTLSVEKLHLSREYI